MQLSDEYTTTSSHIIVNTSTVGICGEHGGAPSSIEFCHKIGLTYVSCSPYRVPIARLAVAQASIRGKANN